MVDLEVRRLGRTEMEPKALGLGSGYLGLPELMSEEEATATIREAIERGVNFIDTAPPYGDGESERCIGLALAGGWREKVYLQTKVGVSSAFFSRFFKRSDIVEFGKQLQAASDGLCRFRVDSRPALRHGTPVGAGGLFGCVTRLESAGTHRSPWQLLCDSMNFISRRLKQAQ